MLKKLVHSKRLGKCFESKHIVYSVTLCDLIWHVISRGGVVVPITNCYIRFTLLYFTLRRACLLSSFCRYKIILFGGRGSLTRAVVL